MDPICTAEARYWRSGLRWQIVLQIMYYTDEGQGRGQGPFFVIGHAWDEATARERTEEANGRLARSESEMRREARNA